jgi:hypothetical protein
VALHHELLKQARHLALREPRNPRQASLRRAVSAAYYALFHLLVSEASQKLVATQPPALRLQVRRAFVHGDMKAACEFFTGNAITDPNNSNNLRHLLTLPIEALITNVAAAFVDLQQARHAADYDHLSQLTRANALLKVSKAEQAFLDWTLIRNSSNANVFLATLLLHNRWRR